MTAANRQRRHRARIDAGLAHVDFWTDEADLTAKLIAGGYLDRNLADDPKAISEAVRRLLERLAVVDIVR